MTTARERYEAKTTVVTFRVHQELYDELKKLKAESDLSFADLIKLGAGIAREEVEAKIAETSELQRELLQLKEAVKAEKQKLAEIAARERQEQHEKLAREIQIFRLFDMGWGVDEARVKLEMSESEASSHFAEWDAMRGERGKIQNEILRKCLRRHITVLQEHINWRATKDALEEAKIQLERCRHLVVDLALITDSEKEFLITEYSYLF